MIFEEVCEVSVSIVESLNEGLTLKDTLSKQIDTENVTF